MTVMASFSGLAVRGRPLTAEERKGGLENCSLHGDFAEFCEDFPELEECGEDCAEECEPTSGYCPGGTPSCESSAGTECVDCWCDFKGYWCICEVMTAH